MVKDLRFQTTPLAEEFDVGDDSHMPAPTSPIRKTTWTRF